NAAIARERSLGSGKKEVAFKDTIKMSSYLLAFIIGEFEATPPIDAGTPLRVVHVPGKRGLTSWAAQIGAFSLKFFADYYGIPYPGDKLDLNAIPDFAAGAMETLGAITFRETALLADEQSASRAELERVADVVSHENAHMWFGDLVTMKWWDDLWLNESFAEWAAHHTSTVATRFTEAWAGFCNGRKNWAYRQDQLPSTHPIAADNYDLEAVEVNFDGITYAKGASALRQLVAWVGEDEFFAGLRTYFKRHAFGNSELKDLLAALEETSGRELQGWAREWLQTCGVNTVRPSFEVDADGRFTSFAIEQAADPQFPTLRRHRLCVGLYDATDSGLLRRSGVEIDVVGARTEVGKLIGESRPDLVLLNDGDLTYAKVRLDEGSLATVVSQIHRFQDSLARALCWGAAWDMTRDAEMRASDWVDLVLRGIEAETDLTAVRAVTASTVRAVSNYAAPAHRGALHARWEAGLHELVLHSAPGSDQQLAFLRALAGAAKSPDTLAFLADLLDGSDTLDGLTIDTDLRWTLITGLARAGRADDAAVDSELQRDKTIAGREHAAAARAAMPTEAAKAEAWRLALAPDTPNETMRSVAMSFQQPDQEHLLEPYVERYLTAAETLWDERGVHQASTVLVLMFPRALATERTRATVKAWLDSSNANPAARRYVSEGLDEIERALAAQAYDGTA
ncbi:MAG: aminopeptidase N, partial [Nocardioidaceae bacterium]